MRRKLSDDQYLLIPYLIFNLAYQIGSSPLKVLNFLFRSAEKAIILLLNCINWLIKQILLIRNVLIVYIYKLRYVFLILYVTCLGYLVTLYYQSIPNPKSENDFLPPGRILISDRNQLPLFDSQETTQQLIEKNYQVDLNAGQLADQLAKKVKTNQTDFLKRKILAWRISHNFPENNLQQLYLYLSNYAVFNYDKLEIYKRSPLAVKLTLANLIKKHGRTKLTSNNFNVEISIDQTLQNSLQEIAVESNQLENLVIVYQVNTKNIVAVINQKTPAAVSNFTKINHLRRLSFSHQQKGLAYDFDFIMEKNDPHLLNRFNSEIQRRYLISALNWKGGERINE